MDLSWSGLALNPAVLQHWQGVINGLYLAIFLTLFLYGVSYSCQRRTWPVMAAFMLLALGFLSLGLNNILFQYVYRPDTLPTLAPWVIQITKIAMPLGLIIFTFVFVTLGALYTFRGYRYLRGQRHLIYLLYGLDAATILAQFFIRDNHVGIVLILGLLILHMLGASFFYLRVLRRASATRSMGWLCLVSAVSVIYLAWLTLTCPGFFQKYLLLPAQSAFVLLAVVFGMLSLRNGHAETAYYLKVRHLDRHDLLPALMRAIHDGEFYLAYQPLLRLADNQICGLEALIRWQHPRQGLIPPDQFIPLAEASGLIYRISEWVMQQAAADTHALLAAGMKVKVHINLSARDFRPERIRFLLDQLREQQVPSQYFGVELTESLLMIQSPQATSSLDLLRQAGISVTLDDFGTGFSSLTYLRDLQLTQLKIDRSFVTDLENSPENWVIIESTLQMSHNLGISVTAEGVETPRAMSLLRDLRCDVVQGYGIARPMPLAELMAWLTAHTNPQPQRLIEYRTTVEPR